MDIMAVHIKTLHTELDRLRARVQYLRRAARLLADEELVDVTTDETSLRYAVHALGSLITSNELFLDRAAGQLEEVTAVHKRMVDVQDIREQRELAESFEDELAAFLVDIRVQRQGVSDSIRSTRELLGHFLEDRGMS